MGIDRERRRELLHLAGACLVLALGIWASTGTLTPYAATLTSPFLWEPCKFALSIDHFHFKAMFLMLDGAPRDQWEFTRSPARGRPGHVPLFQLPLPPADLPRLSPGGGAAPPGRPAARPGGGRAARHRDPPLPVREPRSVLSRVAAPGLLDRPPLSADRGGARGVCGGLLRPGPPSAGRPGSSSRRCSDRRASANSSTIASTDTTGRRPTRKPWRGSARARWASARAPPRLRRA